MAKHKHEMDRDEREDRHQAEESRSAPSTESLWSEPVPAPAPHTPPPTEDMYAKLKAFVGEVRRANVLHSTGERAALELEAALDALLSVQVDPPAAERAHA